MLKYSIFKEAEIYLTVFNEINKENEDSWIKKTFSKIFNDYYEPKFPSDLEDINKPVNNKTLSNISSNVRLLITSNNLIKEIPKSNMPINTIELQNSEYRSSETLKSDVSIQRLMKKQSSLIRWLLHQGMKGLSPYFLDLYFSV